MAMVANGIPARYPRLRIGAIEAGAAWVPSVAHWLRRGVSRPHLFESGQQRLSLEFQPVGATYFGVADARTTTPTELIPASQLATKLAAGYKVFRLPAIFSSAFNAPGTVMVISAERTPPR